MPFVRPQHIVSFSSEDPNNPAENLLTTDSYRRFKCEHPGEKDVYIIFKFEKATQFSSIDIGNECSALIEVHVARSTGNAEQPTFEVLMPAQGIMVADESRNETNTRRVKFFTEKLFDKKISKEKWDLVKVICSQPFNKHITYGLSFITFHTKGDTKAKAHVDVDSDEEGEKQKNPEEPVKIGGFALKSTNDDNSYVKQLTSGSFFAKAKQNNDNSSKSVAAQIRASKTTPSSSSSTSTNTNTSDQQSKSSSKSANRKRSRRNESEDMYEDEEEDDMPLPRRNMLNDTNLAKKKKDQNQNQSPASSQNSSGSASKSQPQPSKSQNKNTTTTPKSKPKLKLVKGGQKRPFNKLFDGVVFVLSGFQNPLRSDLRSKACAMGAKYRPDWNTNCTHLICNFYGTPKFVEVRAGGTGKIVKQDWIEDSYDAKTRFPWRRYCLDRNDRSTDSEEEINCENDNGNDTDNSIEDENESFSLNKGTKSVPVPDPATNQALPSLVDENSPADPEPEVEVEISDVNTKKNSPKKSSPKKNTEKNDADGNEESSRKLDLVSKSLEKDKEKFEGDKKGNVVDQDDDDAYNVSTEEENSRDGLSTSTDLIQKKSNSDNQEKKNRDSLFDGNVFFLYPKGNSFSLPNGLSDEIQSIIEQHEGRLEKELNESVQYVLVDEEQEWADEFSVALVDNPALIFVEYGWILECHKKEKMVDPTTFEVSM